MCVWKYINRSINRRLQLSVISSLSTFYSWDFFMGRRASHEKDHEKNVIVNATICIHDFLSFHSRSLIVFYYFKWYFWTRNTLPRWIYKQPWEQRPNIKWTICVFLSKFQKLIFDATLGVNFWMPHIEHPIIFRVHVKLHIYDLLRCISLISVIVWESQDVMFGMAQNTRC